jgi:Icc-related predicted phosphoesterase
MRVFDWVPKPIHEVPYLMARKGGGATDCVALPITMARVEGLPAALDGLLFAADLQGRESLPPTKRQQKSGRFRYREGRRLLGEVVAEHVRRLCASGDLPPADKLGVVLAGDLWAEPGCRRHGGLGCVGPVWGAFGGTSRWVVGVLGNHDSYDRPRPDEGHSTAPLRMALLDGDVIEVDGLRVGGVGGIIGDADKARRKPERRYLELLENVLRQQPDLVVLHESPEVPEADCWGKSSIRECLLRHGPTLVICGHCHWPTPLQILPNGTQVCNVDARVIVAVR